MRRRICFVQFTMFFLCSQVAGAATLIIAPSYTYLDGDGTVTFSDTTTDAVNFHIATVNPNSANQGVCDLEGKASISGDKGTYEERDEHQQKTGCVVDIVFAHPKVKITGTDSCATYCGMGASFAGNYSAQPAGCDKQATATARREFDQQLSAKNFKAAHAQLGTFVERCAGNVEPNALAWLESDLAVAALKAGDRQACKLHLERANTRIAAALQSKKLKKALATNARLCSQ